MKIGILGTGFGAYHASIYKNHPSIESIKIFGRNEEKLKKIKSDLDIEITNSIDDILNDVSIDLVDVCLPNDLHREYVIKALEKGKNVFCETTISTNLEDAEAIADAEKKYGKRVFIDLFILFDPYYRHVHELIKNNTLGKLRKIEVKRQTPSIWGSLDLDKIVTNLMMHDINFITWILGIPNAISAIGINKNESESTATATFKYDNVIAEIIGSSMMPKSYPFTVGYEAIFDNGVIIYHEEFSSSGSVKYFTEYSANEKKEITLKEGNAYEKSIDHVITCCEKGTETVLSVKNALSSLKTALTIKSLIV